MINTSAEIIVEAFDQCLDYTFGSPLGRDNPHKNDIDIAQSWIDAGADLVLCIMVFSQQMAWMHEKYLRSGHSKDRDMIPHSLRIFDDNILSAVRIKKSGGVDDTEKAYSQWRARVTGWKRKPSLWRSDMWGPPPNEHGCRVPKSILAEL